MDISLILLSIWRVIVVIVTVIAVYTLVIEGWNEFANDSWNIIIIKSFVLLILGLLTSIGGVCLLFIDKIMRSLQ